MYTNFGHIVLWTVLRNADQTGPINTFFYPLTGHIWLPEHLCSQRPVYEVHPPPTEKHDKKEKSHLKYCRQDVFEEQKTFFFFFFRV